MTKLLCKHIWSVDFLMHTVYILPRQLLILKLLSINEINKLFQEMCPNNYTVKKIQLLTLQKK